MEKKTLNFGKAFTELERTGMELIMPIHQFIEGEQYKLSQFSPPLTEETKKIRIGGYDAVMILMRFEGGNVISAYLRQAGEGWEVFRADAKYYSDSAAREAQEKTSRIFGASDFPQIKEAPFEVTGKVTTLAKTERRFAFVERQGMTVAYAIHKYLAEQSGQEICHALRTITGEERIIGNGYAMVISYLFGDGIEIIVYLYDNNTLTEYRQEDWVVFRVKANTTQGEPILLESKDLLTIKENPKFSWYHPNVEDIKEICDEVGIFYDNVAGEGYVSVIRLKESHGRYVLNDKVPYAVLIPGDLARAEEEAQKILDGYLTVNAVAVYYCGPAGEAFRKDSPTGNYKGSKESPFDFVGEHSYDSDVIWSHECALVKAEADVASLQEATNKTGFTITHSDNNNLTMVRLIKTSCAEGNIITDITGQKVSLSFMGLLQSDKGTLINFLFLFIKRGKELSDSEFDKLGKKIAVWFKEETDFSRAHIENVLEKIEKGE